jgi:hypothetical protein
VPTLGNMSHHFLFYPAVYDRWISLAECTDLPVEVIALEPPPFDALPNNLTPSHAHGRRSYDNDQHFANVPTNPGTAENMRAMLESAVGQFYQQFDARGFASYEIYRGAIQATDLLIELRHAGNGNHLITYHADLEALPPIHLFWTRNRAIVAVPLDREVHRQEMKRNEVTMVGYETTNVRVIERLLKVYKEWKQRYEQPSPPAVAISSAPAQFPLTEQEH